MVHGTQRKKKKKKEWGGVEARRLERDIENWGRGWPKKGPWDLEKERQKRKKKRKEWGGVEARRVEKDTENWGRGWLKKSKEKNRRLFISCYY